MFVNVSNVEFRRLLEKIRSEGHKLEEETEGPRHQYKVNGVYWGSTQTGFPCLVWCEIPPKQ